MRVYRRNVRLEKGNGLFESKSNLVGLVQGSWELASGRPALEHDEVHVWRASLAQADSAAHVLDRLLAPEESERARRFVFKRDRDRFIVARGVLRTILGRYLEREPGQLQFSYGKHGKPFLDDTKDLFFNVSHSNTMAVFAVGKGRQLGVDVEYIRRDLDAKAIAARFFSAAEVAALNRLPDHLQVEGFFNCWTRKEAYIKARGEGIFFGLDNFDVSLSPGEAAVLLRVVGQPAETSRWKFQPLHVHPDYAAAVIAEGNDWRLQCWEYPGPNRS
jgi:4'-phosphopantetheinyl transferase